MAPEVIATDVFCLNAAGVGHAEHLDCGIAGVDLAGSILHTAHLFFAADEEFDLFRIEEECDRFQLQIADDSAVVGGDITVEQRDVAEKCPVALDLIFAAERDDVYAVEFGTQIVVGSVTAEFFRECQYAGKSGGTDPADLNDRLILTGDFGTVFSVCYGGKDDSRCRYQRADLSCR